MTQSDGTLLLRRVGCRGLGFGTLGMGKGLVNNHPVLCFIGTFHIPVAVTTSYYELCMLMNDIQMNNTQHNNTTNHNTPLEQFSI